MANFIDAQRMAQEYPDSFQVPTFDELRAVVAGDHIKVCTGGERFWVQVSKGNGTGFTGIITSDLICGHVHHLKKGDEVSVSPHHVYAIIRTSTSPAADDLPHPDDGFPDAVGVADAGV